MFGFRPTPEMVTPDAALAGRAEYPFALPTEHRVLEASPTGPWPEDTEVLFVAMGCFWGAERIMWRLPGVVTTAAGYMGGYTPHPTYEETCTGQTGHTEAVLVAYDPAALSPEAILKAFWENHDPTQGMRQGNDVGTQYRSAAYTTSEAQAAAAAAFADAYGKRLDAAGYGPITTEIASAGPFYFAEEYHQQYLAKNPGGYCGIGGTGVACQIGLDA